MWSRGLSLSIWHLAPRILHSNTGIHWWRNAKQGDLAMSHGDVMTFLFPNSLRLYPSCSSSPFRLVSVSVSIRWVNGLFSRLVGVASGGFSRVCVPDWPAFAISLFVCGPFVLIYSPATLNAPSSSTVAVASAVIRALL